MPFPYDWYFITFRKIYRIAPVPESLFNKVAGFQTATLLKIYSGTGFFLLNLPKFVRTPLYQTPLGACLRKNTSGLLNKNAESVVLK